MRPEDLFNLIAKDNPDFDINKIRDKPNRGYYYGGLKVFCCSEKIEGNKNEEQARSSLYNLISSNNEGYWFTTHNNVVFGVYLMKNN